MTGVRKREDTPLRRDRSWACAHLLMCSCGHVGMWTWKSTSIAALCSLIGHSAFHGHMKPGRARGPHMSKWAHGGHGGALRSQHCAAYRAQRIHGHMKRGRARGPHMSKWAHEGHGRALRSQHSAALSGTAHFMGT